MIPLRGDVMIIIGLSGGIASGKSTISQILKDMEIPVIDSDTIAHTIIQKDSLVIDSLTKAFGTEILNTDGTLNRKILGTIVFNNKENLKKLNNITHPAIKREIIVNIDFYKNAGKRCCVVDGALLMEGIFMDIVDYLILVYVNRDTQLKRLMDRNLIGSEEALKKINSQMPFEDKKKYADYIIDNSYDLEYTKNQVNKIMNEILKMEDLND